LIFSKLWRRAGEENGFIACVKFFIELLLKELRPCVALHLRGSVPSLPLLAAIYVARPYGQTIDYTDDAGRNVILFFLKNCFMSERRGIEPTPIPEEPTEREQKRADYPRVPMDEYRGEIV